MNGLFILFILELFGYIIAVDEICQDEGFDRCTSNNDCCSEFCDKNDDEEFGICEAACGKSTSGKFPWHAGVYRYYNYPGTYSQICGATLISHQVVVSTAHCLEISNYLPNFDAKELSRLKIALGKSDRNLNATQDNFAEIYDVEKIEIGPGYIGRSWLYEADVAFIILKTKINYSRTVRPICVDAGPDNFEHEQLFNRSNGLIVGWGLDGRKDEDTLISAEVEYVERDECIKKGKYIAVDKFCTGAKFSNVTICSNGRGGGVIFEDQKTKSYYLRGITSIGSEECETGKMVSVTKLSNYKELVEKYLDHCKQACRICGKSPSASAETARQLENTEFPWHAVIYEYDKNLNKYNQICGGTLISHKIVISAGHCFSTDEIKNARIVAKDTSMFKIALGKYHRDFTADAPTAQILDVERIDVHEDYRQHVTFWMPNIAFVILKTAVKYTETLRTACIDFGVNKFEDLQLVRRTRGFVVGWGVTEDKEPGERLMLEELKLVHIQECSSRTFLLRKENKNIICAGDESSSGTFCQTDGGGGLFFQDPKTNIYYLRGVASTGFVGCKGGIVLFTKLSFYKNYVEKYVSECKKICRRNNCEPLISKKLDTVCSTSDGLFTECDKPLSNNTMASFTCQPFSYLKIKEQEYNIINCRDGEWDRPLVDDFCIPVFAECGKPVSNLAQPVVSNGNETEYGQFPWHAGIYQYKSSLRSYDLICGGTLISHKVVISAAHCFITEINRKIQMKNLSRFKLVLGKYFRVFDTGRDPLAQIFDIESIELSPEFEGSLNLYVGDIAFLKLKTEVKFTRAVRPICIDVGPDSLEKEHFKKGMMGVVVGWGLTAEQKPSERLMLAEMPFVETEECRNNIHITLRLYVNVDKICMGDKNSNVTVCPGDSGGGLVFQDPTTKAYYLRGVVSLGPRGCKGLEYVMFTRLSWHKDLLEKYLQIV